LKKSSNILPIILAGGSGTRLWPLSRETFPKQYLNLSQDSVDSQFQTTIKRIQKLSNIENPLIICNEEHRFIVAEQCRLINIKTGSIILEPFGKNTAPAITLAAIKATEKNHDPILLILSSDHEIKNESLFLETIKSGEKYALENRLVTFGITPSSPETGFGYIKSKYPLESNNKASEIEKFIEKPEKELAEKLILNKKYTWNSGIFMFKASQIIEEVKKYNPSLFDICNKSIINSSIDLDFQRIDQNLFKKCPNISIDNAVMEKTKLGTVLAFDAEWSDLGSWKSIWENAKKDENKNALKGDIILKNSTGCYLRSENHLVVGLGLKDLIFIDSHDAILIANKDKLDALKDVVEDLKIRGRDEGIIHKKVHRPWGNYTSIEEGKRWKVKTIEVKPSKSLSLQMHKKRAEHWVVVTGKAKVEINNNIYTLNENESTFIPLGSKHRLSNPGTTPLILIEVQSGDYLGEDDIIRFQDFYGRANKIN
tara:strand:+ start:2544 stop:3992 length:1449 start_codon:yes stop_codon:yes gene_type:complete